MDTKTKEFDLTGSIIAYEQGELEEDGFLELFFHLIKTGMAWALQGCYGRTAAALISGGIISQSGEVM
jgi:hypothetical protein